MEWSQVLATPRIMTPVWERCNSPPPPIPDPWTKQDLEELECVTPNRVTGSLQSQAMIGCPTSPRPARILEVKEKGARRPRMTTGRSTWLRRRKQDWLESPVFLDEPSMLNQQGQQLPENTFGRKVRELMGNKN